MTINELKQIQLHRQHITDKTKKFTIVQDLNGLQCQFLVNAFNGLKIRCSENVTTENFGDGLVKNWTIRGTVHILSQEDLPVFLHKGNDSDYLSHNWSTENISRQCKIDPVRLEYIARLLVEKVAKSISTRECLKEECYKAGISKIECSFIFDQWGGLLRPLCERGFLCYKVQEKKEFMICPPFVPMETGTAIIEQARRYFANFAPATIKDAAYYFGWTQTFTKEIMNKLPLIQTEINGRAYFYLDSLRSDYPDIPNCVLLPGFDQLMLGYEKKESIYLSQKNLRGIFNLAGIVMPVILLDGDVVGKWRNKNGKFTFELFETVDDNGKKHIINSMEECYCNIKKIEWLRK